tara:strand:+ start:4152 stop:4484 length:333 start_codon:yes stop_codon:yes gene_type:complete
MYKEQKSHYYQIDHDGFLINYRNWSENVARTIAKIEELELNERHWELIYLIRQYYLEFQHAPTMRSLVNWTKLNLGEQKGTSGYLYFLFPKSPPKQLCRIAGLPKPKNCF